MSFRSYQEFKLNPNAKSFKPSPSATRPQSPVTDGSFYYPPVPPMPLHIAYGVSVLYSLSTSNDQTSTSSFKSLLLCLLIHKN